MVILCPDIYNFDLPEALAQVSRQRREQALRYRHERDQRLCVAAYRLLQDALRWSYGIDAPLPQFIYNDKGKPLLKDHPGVHCSLSHCHQAAAVAVADHPVGIDIESYDQYNEEVACHVMSDDEMERIQASPWPAKEFTRLWTMKESLYKLTGDDHNGDIAHMLDESPAVEFTTVDYPDYLLTTCRYRAGKSD